MSETNKTIKFTLSKIEVEKLDEAIAAGYGLSRPDLCRQAVKRYLMMIDPPLDTDFSAAAIHNENKNAKSYHIYMDGGIQRCEITDAACDCMVSTKDCRSCVVPIEHQQTIMRERRTQRNTSRSNRTKTL